MTRKCRWCGHVAVKPSARCPACRRDYDSGARAPPDDARKEDASGDDADRAPLAVGVPGARLLPPEAGPRRSTAGLALLCIIALISFFAALISAASQSPQSPLLTALYFVIFTIAVAGGAIVQAVDRIR